MIVCSPSIYVQGIAEKATW